MDGYERGMQIHLSFTFNYKKIDSKGHTEGFPIHR
jgi:hypothetical protein